MAVIYGRRRVGKSTLISEFARNKRALFFTALEQADADDLAWNGGRVFRSTRPRSTLGTHPRPVDKGI